MEDKSDENDNEPDSAQPDKDQSDELISNSSLLEKKVIICKAENSGKIKPDKSVFFPDLDYRQDIKKDFLTSMDIRTIAEAVKENAHIVCFSSVESAADIQEARKML